MSVNFLFENVWLCFMNKVIVFFCVSVCFGLVVFMMMKKLVCVGRVSSRLSMVGSSSRWVVICIRK